MSTTMKIDFILLFPDDFNYRQTSVEANEFHSLSNLKVEDEIECELKDTDIIHNAKIISKTYAIYGDITYKLLAAIPQSDKA